MMVGGGGDGGDGGDDYGGDGGEEVFLTALMASATL